MKYEIMEFFSVEFTCRICRTDNKQHGPILELEDNRFIVSAVCDYCGEDYHQPLTTNDLATIRN